MKSSDQGRRIMDCGVSVVIIHNFCLSVLVPLFIRSRESSKVPSIARLVEFMGKAVLSFALSSRKGAVLSELAYCCSLLPLFELLTKSVKPPTSLPLLSSFLTSIFHIFFPLLSLFHPSIFLHDATSFSFSRQRHSSLSTDIQNIRTFFEIHTHTYLSFLNPHTHLAYSFWLIGASKVNSIND